MTSSMHFKINGPNVIHETIDGEAVIINLVTGRYYSLDNIGVEIWDLIANRADIDEIVAELTNRYDTTKVDVENVIWQLINELKDEELIVPDQVQQPNGNKALNRPSVTKSETDKPSFEVPVLQKYTDMEELLLLDPIHEVDETGWPVAKPDPSMQH